MKEAHKRKELEKMTPIVKLLCHCVQHRTYEKGNVPGYTSNMLKILVINVETREKLYTATHVDIKDKVL